LITGIVVQAAEQPVMMTAGTVDTNLKPAGHTAFHRFPVSAACESLRWCCRDLNKDCPHGRLHLYRARAQEFSARCRTADIVIAVSAEKRNIVRII
jgi:hypothetical protein